MSDVSGYLHDRERYDDVEEPLRVLLDAFAKTLHVTYRGAISQSSQDGDTASVQPSINGRVQMPDGTYQSIPFPELQDVPIHHMTGGGHSTTHPTQQGDEGTLLIHSRPLDTWKQSGGQQDPIDHRVQHMGDATWLSGGRSDPNKLQNVSQVSSQQRSDDGQHAYDCNKTNGLTHYSGKMVMSLAGTQTATVETNDGHQVSSPKILHNCAQA